MPGHGRLDAESLGRAIHAALVQRGQLMAAAVRRAVFGGDDGDEAGVVAAVLAEAGAAGTPAPTRRVRAR
jgi:hypothetical protein